MADQQTRDLFARVLVRAYSVKWPSLYCAFKPVFGASFLIGRRRIDVMMCPHCGEMPYYEGSRLLATADLSAAASKLFPVYRRIYRNDPVVQSVTQ